MKKLILGAFMLAFAGTAIAQTDNTVQTTTTPQATTTVAAPAASTAPAATATTAPAATTTADMNATAGTSDGKDYAKVQQSQIAPAVLKQAVAKYKDYALVEALAATDASEYKLVLTKDGKDVAAYYKSNGEFIKEETV